MILNQGLSLLNMADSRVILEVQEKFQDSEITFSEIFIFSRPMPFAPKAQKGIDKGKKSTRFLERCIIG